jgi:DNA-binding protein HU-beta
MNKDELINAVASKTGASKKETEDALNTILDVIEKTMVQGDKVTLTGFGVFSANQRAARVGINPQTKEKLQIPAMKVPKFKAGKSLKDAVK